MSGPGDIRRREGRTGAEHNLAESAVSGVSTDTTLTPLDVRMLSILREGVDRHGQYRSTFRLLSVGAGCARSTAHQSLRRLEAAGLIRVEVTGYGLVITPLGGGR